jgi:uncharacterized protein
MINRKTEKQIEKLIQHFPVVGIIGARQVGKTTLAKKIAMLLPKKSIYFDLESPQVFSQITDNPTWFLNQYQDHTIIIDEVQLMLPIFPLLRSLIDQKRESGRFILLGSASLDFLAKSSETLAGRIAYIELSPILYQEIEKNSTISIHTHWFRGGFPDALLSADDEVWAIWQDNFIRTYISKDLPVLGIMASASALYNMLQMLTGVHGSLLTISDLANALNLNFRTVIHYIEVLEQAFLIRRLQPWSVNVSKRVVKSPKLYFRDTGNLHYLSNIMGYDWLVRNRLVGHSWEGYVIEQVCCCLINNIKPYFYRTSNGAEIDLVLVQGITPMASIEIKLSNANMLSKGSTEALKELQTPHNFVVTTDGGNYFHNPQWKVCNISELLNNLIELGFVKPI